MMTVIVGGQVVNEDDARALRDMVYTKPTTDSNWEACKMHWMTPENVAWLILMTSEKLNPK